MSVEVTDFTTGQIDRYTQVGTILPSTCKVGHIFFLVGASPNKVYACFSTNVWTEVISGDVVGAFPRTVSIITVATRTTDFAPLNFRSGNQLSILPAGLYRITAYLGTVMTGVGTMQISLTWGDSVGSKSDSIFINGHNFNSTGFPSVASKMIYSSGVEDITIEGITSIGSGIPSYQMYAICERVG